MYYLDNAATTPVREDAARAAYETMVNGWGNPSARYTLGAEMTAKVKGWRQDVAKALGCGEDELIFTSCGTESDNWAIRAAVEDGRIPPSRHAAYRELYATLKEKKKW